MKYARKVGRVKPWQVVTNANGPAWMPLEVVGAISNATGADIVTNLTGHALLPRVSQQFFYDADGNLTSDSLWTNTWNAENRRVTIESVAGVPTAAKRRGQWTHLGDGRWIERIVSTNNGSGWSPEFTNRYVWDGQVLLAILDHTNGLVMSFMRGVDLSGSQQGAGGVGGLLCLTSHLSPPTSHFVSYDGNGNVTALVDAATGEESARYEYGPFGEAIRMTGPMATLNPVRFSTQYADDVTGDVKYLFRDYGVSEGRWPNRDPIGEQGFTLVTSGRQPTTAAGVDEDGESPPHSTPEETNIYGFVGNDSINYLDDSGLRIRRFPRVEPPPRPPHTDPREPPMEDWPGPTVDQWNDWLLRHIGADARRLCAKKQRPSIMGCGCCVVSVCWNEGINTGTVSMYATSAFVSGNSCSEVRRSFRLHGTIGAACPKRWNSDTILIPW